MIHTGTPRPGCMLHPDSNSPSTELVAIPPEASVSYIEKALATSSSVGSCDGGGAAVVICGLLGLEPVFRCVLCAQRGAVQALLTIDCMIREQRWDKLYIKKCLWITP